MRHVVDGKLVLNGTRKIGDGLSRFVDGREVGECGMFHLEHELQRGNLCTGKATAASSPEAKQEALAYLKPLIQNRVVFSIDPGVKDEISLVSTFSTMDADGNIRSDNSKYRMTSVTRNDGSGVFRYCDFKMTQLRRDVHEYDDKLRELKKNHGRISDHKSFKDDHMSAFEKYGIPIMKANATKTSLRARFRLDNKKRSFMASLANMFLALADAKLKRMAREQGWDPGTLKDRQFGRPLILFGDGKFNSCMKGFLPAAPKKIARHLAKFFPVLMIGEFRTSKLCSNCHRPLVKVGKKGTRLWKCKHCKVRDFHCKQKCDECARQPMKDLHVNKDISAAFAIFKIFTCIMATGQRPRAYRPQQTTQMGASITPLH